MVKLSIPILGFAAGMHGEGGVSAIFGIGEIPAPADVAKAPEDAMVTRTGLAYKVLTPPQCPPEACERPLAFDTVEVDYTGWQTNGKMFDSSLSRGQRSTFKVNQVIKGWTEGLQAMAIGEKRRFWIPASLAYGDNPAPGRPSGPLVFDVELFGIQRGPKPPSVPADIAGPPADALVNPSGLYLKVLKPGKPAFKGRPVQQDSEVTVEYSGWKPNGDLVVSTQVDGKRAQLRVGDIQLAGLREGLVGMILGESRRLWIPSKLTNGKSSLVFDVEVFGIQ
jgi:peptidylprolyl isomerase